jgi:hypothetical protein
MIPVEQLHDFIVRAKAATHAGSGEKEKVSCRPASHDLRFSDGLFLYMDSYFGGADFIGEEVVWFEGTPIWAMNYYGRILFPERITAAETGGMIQKSLTKLYQQERFLGGFQNTEGQDTYYDTNTGDTVSFNGLEWIERGGLRVYELVYHGGLIK